MMHNTIAERRGGDHTRLRVAHSDFHVAAGPPGLRQQFALQPQKLRFQSSGERRGARLAALADHRLAVGGMQRLKLAMPPNRLSCCVGTLRLYPAANQAADFIDAARRVLVAPCVDQAQLVRQPHEKAQSFQSQIGVSQQCFASARVGGGDQGVQHVERGGFDAIAEDELLRCGEICPTRAPARAGTGTSLPGLGRYVARCWPSHLCGMGITVGVELAEQFLPGRGQTYSGIKRHRTPTGGGFAPYPPRGKDARMQEANEFWPGGNRRCRPREPRVRSCRGSRRGYT